MQNEDKNNVQYFLDLIRRSRRGKFKVYIGMIGRMEQNTGSKQMKG